MLEATDGRNVFDAALTAALKWVKESVANAKGADAFYTGSLAYPECWRGSTATDEPVAFATDCFCAKEGSAWSFEMDEPDNSERGKACRLRTRIGIRETGECATVNVQVTRRVRAGFSGSLL